MSVWKNTKVLESMDLSIYKKLHEVKLHERIKLNMNGKKKG